MEETLSSSLSSDYEKQPQCGAATSHMYNLNEGIHHEPKGETNNKLYTKKKKKGLKSSKLRSTPPPERHIFSINCLLSHWKNFRQ